MNWFDRWFAAKSKYVWDESRREGWGLPASKRDVDVLEKSLRAEIRFYVDRLVTLEQETEKLKQKPKKRKNT